MNHNWGGGLNVYMGIYSSQNIKKLTRKAVTFIKSISRYCRSKFVQIIIPKGRRGRRGATKGCQIFTRE